MNGTPALPFDEAEIRAAFDAASFQRGRDYARYGAVRALELAADGHELAGLVQGTTRQPYRVQVKVGGGRAAGSSAPAPARSAASASTPPR